MGTLSEWWCVVVVYCTYLACVGRAKSAENSIAKEKSGYCTVVHGIEPLRVPNKRFVGFHPGVWQGNKCGVSSWEIC